MTKRKESGRRFLRARAKQEERMKKASQATSDTAPKVPVTSNFLARRPSKKSVKRTRNISGSGLSVRVLPSMSIRKIRTDKGILRRVRAFTKISCINFIVYFTLSLMGDLSK